MFVLPMLTKSNSIFFTTNKKIEMFFLQIYQVSNKNKMTEKREEFERGMSQIISNIHMNIHSNTRLLSINRSACLHNEKYMDVLTNEEIDRFKTIMKNLKESIKDIEYIDGVSCKDRFKLARASIELKHTIEHTIELIETTHSSRFIFK
jgi:hypothetical protein